jgi:hypothetical protein
VGRGGKGKGREGWGREDRDGEKRRQREKRRRREKRRQRGRQRGEMGKAERRKGKGRRERGEWQKGERGKTEGREGERKRGERAKERVREGDTINPFKVLIFVLSHCIGSILSSDFLIFNLAIFFIGLIDLCSLIVSVHCTPDTPYLLALCGLKFLLAGISRSFEFRCIPVSTSKRFMQKSLCCVCESSRQKLSNANGLKRSNAI